MSNEELQATKIAFRLYDEQFWTPPCYQCDNSNENLWIACSRNRGHKGPHVSWFWKKAWNRRGELVDL